VILFSQSWLVVRKVAGVLLVIAGLVVAYLWFYKLAPMRHLADSKWLETHSEKSRWLEEQKDYERMGSSPDLEFRGDRIGYYGNKEWFLWLEGKATTDKKFRVCGCTETAMALMSNQHADSWEEWTQTNKSRTQEEWIQAGFTKYGVSDHLPPNPSDTGPLLKLLGRKRWDFLMGGPQGTNAPDAIPSYIQYNAFRWLRDSGFNPMAFAVSNATVVASQEMTFALLRFARMSGEFPVGDKLGILTFGEKTDRHFEFGTPAFMAPWVRAVVYSLVIVLPLIGLLLVIFRPRK
jgi:hypothetical protein